jgi:predicted outer membrane repeat protein
MSRAFISFNRNHSGRDGSLIYEETCTIPDTACLLTKISDNPTLGIKSAHDSRYGVILNQTLFNHIFKELFGCAT